MKHKCRLKHLRCGLACEVKQTGLSEIRLDEHDWSQINNLLWLLIFCGSDFWHLAGLKRISTMFASLTYFVSVWKHQGVRYSCARWVGVGGCLQFAVLITLESFVASMSGKNKTKHLDHRCYCISGPAKTNSFLCFSCAATSSENRSMLWVHCQVKTLRHHDYVLGWNQITGSCHSSGSESAIFVFVFFSLWPELWVQPVLLSSKSPAVRCCTGLWKYFSINLLIRPARSPIWILPYFHWLVVDQPALSFLIVLWHSLY